MFLGGIVWGFVIATLLNIANSSDPTYFEHRQVWLPSDNDPLLAPADSGPRV